MKSNTLFSRLAIIILALLLVISVSCADKDSGDDNGDDDSDDDDDDSTSGVGSYSVYINMAPAVIGDAAQSQTLTLYNANGESFDADCVLIKDFLDGVSQFAEDAPNFTYEFINNLDQPSANSKASLPSYDDMAKAAFYELESEDGIGIAWTEAGHEDLTIEDMDNGRLVTYPVSGAYDIKTLSWVNERSGDDISHLDETVAVQGIVTMGSGIMVSGSYLKTFIQKDGQGIKIFADMGATEDDMGYDGELFSEIYTFEGDEVFVKGTITAHDGMIEFIPVSGYHVAVLSMLNPVEAPISATISDLAADPYEYAGAMVRLDDLDIVNINPNDPTTDWPEYGLKSKEITIQHTSGGDTMKMPVYERTGIPGSIKPEAGFDAVGVVEINGPTLAMYPRKIEDINPADTALQGEVTVSVYGETNAAAVDLSTLQAGMQVLEEGGTAEPVVSLGSVILAAGISRNPKILEYKPVASDDRMPFETQIYDETRSGVFYQDVDEKAAAKVNSFYWEGMDLSEIYYLNDVDRIFAYRAIDPPEEGEAEHGEGITLAIKGKKYNIKFTSVPHTEYDGKDAIAFSDLIHEDVINLYTMDGSFTTDEVRLIYDYRLVSFDESEEKTVTFADLADGYLVLADPPYSVFPNLGAEGSVDDMYLVDMMRFIKVDDGTGSDPTVVYLRDCETEEAEVDEGVFEQVVFYETVLKEAGIDTTTNMYLYDFELVASDQFSSWWTFGHDHLNRMFIRPYENKGYTIDPDLGTYGGRVSTKGIYEIAMHDVPQEAPSIEVENGRWGTDANTCNGCHYKHEEIQIPIDCTSCHTVP